MSLLQFHQSEFLQSASKLAQCPPDIGREVAFAGRSNAGKSSAINALTGNRKLARTSKTPGRTQLINFFSVTDDTRLVDLPGHGYAKVPVSIREHWKTHLDHYLRGRDSLKGLVIVTDMRRPLLEFDQAMLEWANSSGLSTHILLSKADKLKYGPAKSCLLKLQKDFAEYPNVSFQLFSALKNTGVNEAQKRIKGWLTAPNEELD